MKKGDRVRIRATMESRKLTSSEVLRLSSENKIAPAPLLLETLARRPDRANTHYRDLKALARREFRTPIEGIFVGITVRWSGYTTWGGYDEPNYFTGRDKYDLYMVIPLQVESFAYTYGGPNRGKTTWFVRRAGDRYLKPIPVLPKDLEPV